MTETKAEWELAWERSAQKRLYEGGDRGETEATRYGFRAGYLDATKSLRLAKTASTERPVATPAAQSKAEVTRDHRMWGIAAWEEWSFGALTPDHMAWLDGRDHEGDYSWEEQFAQALADAEARGRSSATPPADLTAEVERLRARVAELEKLKAALRKFTPSKRDPLRCLICEEPRHEHYSGPFAEPNALYCSKYYVPRAPVSDPPPEPVAETTVPLPGKGQR